VVERDVKATG
jgi:predicted esterase